MVVLALTNVRNAINVQSNMDQRQIAECAIEIVKDYPDMTIEDLNTCLNNGRKSKYGDIYRLDMSVIFGWIERFNQSNATSPDGTDYSKLLGYRPDLHGKPGFKFSISPGGGAISYDRI